MPRPPAVRLPAVVLAAVLLSAAGAPFPARGETRDPQAVAIAEKTMTAMGGKDAFDALSLLTFRFTVEREGSAVGEGWLHVWDRQTGRYLLMGTNKDGKPLEVRFNVNTRKGNAWVDGKPAGPGDTASYLEYAYARFINDTYWLLMPWKWLDPGVNLEYKGQEKAEGKLCDVVHLTFGNDVGLTSNDAYWAYVSVDTGLMIQWQYLLQDDAGNPGTGERSTFRWEDWRDVGGGVRLSRRKASVDGKSAIVFPFIRMSAEADEKEFGPPPTPVPAPEEGGETAPDR